MYAYVFNYIVCMDLINKEATERQDEQVQIVSGGRDLQLLFLRIYVCFCVNYPPSYANHFANETSLHANIVVKSVVSNRG